MLRNNQRSCSCGCGAQAQPMPMPMPDCGYQQAVALPEQVEGCGQSFAPGQVLNVGGGCKVSHGEVQTVVEQPVYAAPNVFHHHNTIKHIQPVVVQDVHHYHSHHEYVIQQQKKADEVIEHSHGVNPGPITTAPAQPCGSGVAMPLPEYVGSEEGIQTLPGYVGGGYQQAVTLPGQAGCGQAAAMPMPMPMPATPCGCGARPRPRPRPRPCGCRR